MQWGGMVFEGASFLFICHRCFVYFHIFKKVHESKNLSERALFKQKTQKQIQQK